MKCITYKKGFKYQLDQEYHLQIGIKPQQDICCVGDFVGLTQEGLLSIKKGYAWDGPSGPTIDSFNFMRGSLVHDALYQLMRNDLLDREIHKVPADRLLQKMCMEDGMSRLRAWTVYQALQVGGRPATLKANLKKTINAPYNCR